MAKTITHQRFSKMNSAILLGKISKGNMKEGEAKEAAGIIANRFPSPKKEPSVSTWRLITVLRSPNYSRVH